MMRAQEEQRLLMRSLDLQEISEVRLSAQGPGQRRIQEREKIGPFIALAKEADVSIRIMKGR